MKRGFGIILLLILLLVSGAAFSGKFLVINQPQESDVILVLAGETDRRPVLALELLNQGYGKKVIIDVNTGLRIYRWTLPELAQEYVRELPQAASIIICPIQGLSTKEETRDTAVCLQSAGAREVLLVTSDFHTRRALSIFRRELPNYRFHVAAAADPRFGTEWWRHREWAKVNVDEWQRFLWWETIDQWR